MRCHVLHLLFLSILGLTVNAFTPLSTNGRRLTLRTAAEEEPSSGVVELGETTPEEDLPNISLRDNIAFTTPSVPNKTFETRVTFIDPVINPQTRVASIRTEISNPRGTLKPEMLVYGTLSNKVSSKEK